jgi:hypothetical protein
MLYYLLRHGLQGAVTGPAASVSSGNVVGTQFSDPIQPQQIRNSRVEAQKSIHILTSSLGILMHTPIWETPTEDFVCVCHIKAVGLACGKEKKNKKRANYFLLKSMLGSWNHHFCWQSYLYGHVVMEFTYQQGTLGNVVTIWEVLYPDKMWGLFLKEKSRWWTLEASAMIVIEGMKKWEAELK